MTEQLRTIFEALFWISAGLLFYVYLGYPLVMLLLSRRRRRLIKAQHPLPSVSLIISAYNESRVIVAKLENALALDYPKGLFEIVVISDCSDDGTDEMVRQFVNPRLTLVRQAQRLGKTAGLNLGVPRASGQILVFSDANTLYRPDAIRQLVRHFADPRVGYVVGSSRYLDDGQSSQAAQSEGLYWNLETWLKVCESRFHSVVGGDGAIYAIRRELYTPLRSTDINDFLNPLQIINLGYVGVLEPAAVGFEKAAGSFQQEFHRKTRIISRSLNALVRVPGVLNPFKDSRHWFMLISHKVLRWFAPCFMVLLLINSVPLWKIPLYQVIALLQLAFYSLALVGWMGQGKKSAAKIFYLPYYFCLINLASLVGIFKYLRGDLSGTWSPVRHESDNEREEKGPAILDSHTPL